MENDWKNSLSFDDKGNLTKSISNYRAIFTHDENLSQIRFDTFCQDDISFSPLFFNVNGNKGVAAGLSNVQFWSDGEPLTSRVRAEDEFDALDVDDDEDFLN